MQLFLSFAQYVSHVKSILLLLIAWFCCCCGYLCCKIYIYIYIQAVKPFEFFHQAQRQIRWKYFHNPLIIGKMFSGFISRRKVKMKCSWCVKHGSQTNMHDNDSYTIEHAQYRANWISIDFKYKVNKQIQKKNLRLVKSSDDCYLVVYMLKCLCFVYVCLFVWLCEKKNNERECE